jgi:type I restriction enzyme S subunit
MKQDWELKKLGEIILENKKSTLKSKGNEVGEYPFFISGMKVKTYNKSIIDGQNIYLPTGGNFYVHFYEGKASYSTDTWSLRTCNNTDIKYFYFFLLLNRDFINEKHFKGATIKHLQKKDFREIEIPLPSLQEQLRIVAILDEAFAAIAKAKANAEQNLKNAKELFESYLQRVFENKGEGWEEKTLGDIGKPSMCKRILKNQTSSTGDIPFYKIGTFGKKPNAFISKEIYNEFRSKYSFPKNGDILISASGTIGRRVRYDGEPAFFQDSNIVWIDNDESQVLNDYLYVFYEFCDWQPSKGATIARLYNSNLTSIKIVFPKSLEEQKNILKKINLISVETKKLEAIYNQKLNDLDELKKSVLQKAFSGELKTAKALI